MFATDSRGCFRRPAFAGDWRRASCGFLCGLLLLAGVAARSHGQTGTAGRSYPGQIYFQTFRAVAEGDFPAALKWFQSAARAGVRSTQGRWIDSICYYAMTGECFYQLGDYDHALQNYDAALQLYLAHSDWLRRVKFPTAIRPAQDAIRGRITWGPSRRASQLGQFPNNMQFLRGRLDNDRVLQQGGVVVAPEFVLVNVTEIVRCTALALRRRRELLGPICRHDALTPQLVDRFEGRIAPANHWSQAWVNVQRGLAQAGAERLEEATRNLQAAIVVGGQYDHPLTATALIELGKIAQAQGNIEQAAYYFFEATLAAAQFSQTLEVEEAFRLGSKLHVAIGKLEPYPALAPAAAWATRERFRFLQSSLFRLAADNLAFAGQTDDATTMLAKAQKSLKRRAARNPRVLARTQFLTAATAAQRGRLDESDAALRSALELQRGTSLGLFRAAMVDRLYQSGTFTDRIAAMLYDKLLADPADGDWSNDALESLALLTTDRTLSFENWFQAVLSRQDTQKAIEIGDQMRRHKFYSSLPLGGRLLSLRWLLAAPAELLDDNARLRRNDLLSRLPDFQELNDRSRELRTELQQIPLAAADAPQQQKAAAVAKELADVSQQQEEMLSIVALRREPCPLLFPPFATTAQIQETLRPEELLLIYVKSGPELHAFMLSAEKYAHWRVGTPAQIKQTLSKMLQAIGNHDENAAVNADQFARTDWQPLAEKLRDQLIQRQQFGFWNRFERLVIVPDDLVWHVPFEMLPIPAAGDAADKRTMPLISKTKVRYAPTAALSMADPRPEPRWRTTPVLVGRLFPRNPQATQEQFNEWRDMLPRLEALPNRLPAAAGILRATWDRLVVLDDLDNRRHPNHDWSPAKTEKETADNQLQRWMQLPWGGPEEVLLPGFHTAAEDGLRQADDGTPLFLASTGLMAAGAKTVLLSRWRTGGQTSFSMMREFLQERQDLSPPQAWQRAVLMVRKTGVDAEFEPRVNNVSAEVELMAEHPFFWSGFMLFDRSQREENPERAAASRQEAPRL